jgi:hypothetical protein
MPNIDFSVRRDPEDTTVRIRATRDEFRDATRAIMEDAIAHGAATARALAPRGPIRAGNVGRRIVDSIQEEISPRPTPGGAGGGAYWEGSFHASAMISPHLRFVMEGTRGVIRPARGNVLALQKEGEEVHFRRWVSGQSPQASWWDAAQEETNRYVSDHVDAIRPQ